MKIKHWQGYGTVNAHRITKDHSVRLHIYVIGNHEWGIVNEDEYDLWSWLVRHFERDVSDYMEWHNMHPKIIVKPGHTFDPIKQQYIDDCHYYFDY